MHSISSSTVISGLAMRATRAASTSPRVWGGVGGALAPAVLGARRGGARAAPPGAEVPLPVHQRVPQREVLDHPHERIIDRGVSVGVVLADDVPDDAGGVLVRVAP